MDVYDQQVYGVLELVALLDRVAVETLIPDLTLRLRSSEHKRGLGRNAALRWASLGRRNGRGGQPQITVREADPNYREAT